MSKLNGEKTTKSDLMGDSMFGLGMYEQCFPRRVTGTTVTRRSSSLQCFFLLINETLLTSLSMAKEFERSQLAKELQNHHRSRTSNTAKKVANYTMNSETVFVKTFNACSVF